MALVIGLGVYWTRCASGQEYSPEHPKVVSMVDRAVGWLASVGGVQHAHGYQVLVSYAVLLGQSDPDHPAVLRGVDVALDLIRNANSGYKDNEIVYAVSMAIVLLANHDPIKHQAALETGREWLEHVQRPHGGYGYINGQHPDSGDTSQIQYVVLALWTLSKVGIQVKTSTIEGIVKYLMSTQDPGGAWGYQGIIAPGPPGARLVSQSGVSRSLGTAGICGVLMASDILKLFGDVSKNEDGIPSVFQRVDLRRSSDQGDRAELRRKDIEDTIEKAFKYQDENQPQGRSWYYYWRYGQERYESFREKVTGKPSFDWYDQAVEEFAKNQKENGGFMGEGSISSHVDTAFVVLFLVRGTKRSLGKADEGLAFGGYELPRDVTSVRMVGDRLVSDAEVSVENMLELMEGDANQVTEGMLPRDMQLSSDPQTRAAQAARLARLLSSKNPTSRQLAARLLGRCEDTHVAPDLIYALMDPDPYVPQIAEESLRLLSRKLTAGHLKVNPSDEERVAAVRYWKQWYLGLKPNYVFPATTGP